MRRLLTLLLALALVFGVPAAGWAGETAAASNSGFAGGSGTEADPWQIANADQLNNVRNYLGAGNSDMHFILVDDIDLDEPPYNSGEGWVPIGMNDASFQGHFDGNGKIIENLFINASGIFAGLFGVIEGADIRNVTLLDVANTVYNPVLSNIGGLAGFAYNSEIIASTVTGVINGNEFGINYIGGLLGYGYDTGISGCTVAVTVDGSSQSFAGGLAGLLGGNSSVTSSYTTGAVSALGRVGGLVGFLLDSSSVSDSYATGAVSGSYDAGGLVGINSGTITASYYDRETTGQDDTGKGEPRSTADMTFPYNTANTYLGWDFSGIWDIQPGINNGYPVLRWQDYTPTIDKTALPGAILAAHTNKDSVQVSVDGSDVDPADLWVTQSDKDAYAAVIAVAQDIYDNINATQQQVDDAVAALAAATATFDAAKQPGTFSEPQPGDELRDRMDTIKQETDERFDDIKEEIKESSDDKKQETIDRFAVLKTGIKGKFSR